MQMHRWSVSTAVAAGLLENVGLPPALTETAHPCRFRAPMAEFL
jgi:hypothetical protein